MYDVKAALEKLRPAVFRTLNHKRVNGEAALAEPLVMITSWTSLRVLVVHILQFIDEPTIISY